MADSKQTLLCTYLSAVLLIGLGANSLFGWAWIDPLAALVIAAVAAREGWQTWRGDTCCAPVTAAPVTAGSVTAGSVTAGAVTAGAVSGDSSCGDGCCTRR